jgi:glycosyltransferase involved in cell wall biosynthesis
MMIAIGISTAGRPDLLGRTLAQLEKQIRPADRTVVCAPSLRDVGDLAGAARGVEVVTSGRGLTRQRNAILDAAEDCDLLAFFDDDFVPAASYLAAAEALFSARPEIVLSTGAVLADGIRGPGITHAEALALLDRHADHVPGGGGVRPVYNGYG